MGELPSGTVTLLFTDMEGSTLLLQHVGEHYTNILEVCRNLLRMAFHQYHGHVVDTQGDAFFVAFARASDAVAAAVTAQRSLTSQEWPEGIAVRVRMGLHTGEPQLAAEGYVGLDVHRAARIMSVAHGGQILLSQTTRELVEHQLPDGTSLRDLGAHRLKDLEHPSHLYQLVIEDLLTDFPPLKTLDSHTHNLPVQLTPLIGREKEIGAIVHLLQQQKVRLLTLTGPGGGGKTRLGLQVAAELIDRFADGVYFVNLAPISDPALVMPTIAQTLGVKESAGHALEDSISAWLRVKEVLLLLDNFEQIVEAAIEVVTLLARCPTLNVLITSRAVLRVQGEHEFAVPPLGIPDPRHLPEAVALSLYEAVALFIARAQMINPAFQVTNANAPAVAEICVRLDGLPLAIELAAARSKVLPPKALLARLGQRFTVLTSGAQDVPARQQTLRNTIAWSYDLLDAQEQRLFRRLSVFVGGCTLEAIEALYAALDDEANQVLDGISSLIDKSLLRQIEQEAVEPRFIMLETIREYGREALSICGEMETTRHAHAMYYLALAKAAEQEWEGPREAEWYARLEQEYDNLRAAMNCVLEQGETEVALHLGIALWWFWEESGSYREGWNFLERALEGSEKFDSPMRAKALLAAGNLAIWLHMYEGGERLCQKSLELFQAIGDSTGMAAALNFLALAPYFRCDYAAAKAKCEESLLLSRKVGDKSLIAWSVSRLAEMAIMQGDYLEARPLLEEALAIYNELGYIDGVVVALLWSANLFFFQGDLAQAHAVTEECLRLNGETGNKLIEANVLVGLGEIAFFQGDISTAHQQFEKSYAFFKEKADESQIAWTISFLAKVIAAQGDLTAARALYEESLMRGQGMNNYLSKLDLPPALEGLAAVVAAQNEPIWASRLWGTAEALREAYGIPLAPVYRPDYERAVASARTQLGEQPFTRAWDEGRSLTPEQVFVVRGEVTNTSLQSSSPPTEKSPQLYPDGLTAREVEVLCLVAQGLSNVEIAEKLVISLLTVKAHMRSLYNKLDISSRSAATRYAIEHQLV